MNIIEKEVWVIMSKDRSVIAKGVPRDRWLCQVNNTKDNKRILTYNSKIKAELAYKDSWFFIDAGVDEGLTKDDLEAVKVLITYKELNDN